VPHTHRVWNYVVGMVGPTDVRDLQARVRSYFSALEQSVASVKLPLDQSAFSGQAWVRMSERVGQFLNEEATNDWNPLAHIYAGAAYERGRVIIDDLDKWRDQLATLKATNVPAPLPVPHSDIGLAGGLGFVAAAVVILMLLRNR
jgi:hypothetical protein